MTGNLSMREKDKYTRPGNTYWKADKECPECGGVVSCNGKLFDCTECDWWEPVNEEK